MTDLRQFLCTQEINIKNRFLPWLQNRFEDLVDHEVPACRRKYSAKDAPNLFYNQTMVICIFDELYKNELLIQK